MKKIVSLTLICALITFAGCVHNNNKKPYQPSRLTTNTRNNILDTFFFHGLNDLESNLFL